jgi:hypothetical protein
MGQSPLSLFFPAVKVFLPQILRRRAQPVRTIQARPQGASQGFKPFVISVPRPPRPRQPFWAQMARFVAGFFAPSLPRPKVMTIPRQPVRRLPPAAYLTRPPMPNTVPVPPPVVPYDIIEAAIAYLRTSSSIVSTFGDAPPTVPKFFSDVLQRDIPFPYLGFSEPNEVEGYETIDYGQRFSTMVQGVVEVHVRGAAPQFGKKSLRQLAEGVIAPWLNDAPLVFQNGVLVYFRKTDRQYPIITEAGMQAGIAVYCFRMQYLYMIERFVT